MPLQSLSEIENRQLYKLKGVLTYASSRVPYYQNAFRNLGLTSYDICTFADFQRLPIISKKIMQDHWPDFISHDYDVAKLVAKYTSGSSGQPLKCVMTPQERLVAGRHMFRARMKLGLSFPLQWVILGGAVRFASGMTELSQQKEQGHNEKLVLASLELPPPVIEEHIEKLLAFQPQWIYGMPSALSLIATYAKEHNRQVNLHNLQLIEMVGEFLFDSQRQVIEEAFGIHPVSQYACQEIWGIGFECKYGKMHLLTENAYVEIVGANGHPVKPGEVGEVVITGLTNRAQPFIRYRLGDLASIQSGECACGDQSPSIQLVGGRVTEKIFGVENKIGSLVFDSIVRAMYQQGFEGIRQYRVIQRDKDYFEIWIVKSTGWSNACQTSFEDQTRRLLGNQTQLQFFFKELIPPLASGKDRPFMVDLINAG